LHNPNAVLTSTTDNDRAPRSLWRFVPTPLAWVALQLHLVFLGASSLLWNLFALPLYWLLPERAGRTLGRQGVAWVYGSFWRVATATGMLRLDSEALRPLRDEAGLVVVANHPSMLDAMMLVAELPRGACIMKASLLRNPFLGPGAKLARYIPNDSPHGMIRASVAALQEGGQLVLFPEGTRTQQWPLSPLTGSFAVIAKRARAPVQTVFIDTDSPYLGKGWPIWRLPPLPIVFRARLGRRFEPRENHHELVAEVQSHLMQGLRAGPMAQGPQQTESE
jgi:1-acyl-sn-glycerol-3-phosphate acyltransferase